jgi:hypothetical protein
MRTGSLVIPSTLAAALVGCPPQQSAPGPCVRGYAVPAGVTAPSASVRPAVDLAPCSPTFTGEFTCTTRAGCTVIYSDGTPRAGDPAISVFCPSEPAGCLFGLTSAGVPQLGPCPTLEVSGQQCSNNFDLRDSTRSSFSCAATESGCTLPEGGTGQRLAFVRRTVSGAVESTACPTPCVAFS